MSRSPSVAAHLIAQNSLDAPMVHRVAAKDDACSTKDCDDCKSCDADCCGKDSSCEKSGNGRVATHPEVSLTKVLSYQFEPLVDRMIAKYQWSEAKANQLYADMLRFLYLAAVTTVPAAPSPDIDEIWHNFILFTEDYYVFCKEHFGRFIHHRPRRKTDVPSKRNVVQETLVEARTLFGTLSDSWNYRRADGTVILANGDNPSQVNDGDCDAGGEPCNPSTNCQDE